MLTSSRIKLITLINLKKKHSISDKSHQFGLNQLNLNE